MNTHELQQRRRNRMVLVTIAVLFFGSMLVAGALRFSGWQPTGMKNKGELLQPPGDLRALVPRLASGEAYAWEPTTRTWRIVVAPPADCGEPCVALSKQLDVVWRLFGKDADQVHILWLGTPPAGIVRNEATRVLQASPEFAAALPRLQVPGASGVPVYVVDPNGFVILRYAPGFDPADLRADLSKLLKLI